MPENRNQEIFLPILNIVELPFIPVKFLIHCFGQIHSTSSLFLLSIYIIQRTEYFVSRSAISEVFFWPALFFPGNFPLFLLLASFKIQTGNFDE